MQQLGVCVRCEPVAVREDDERKRSSCPLGLGVWKIPGGRRTDRGVADHGHERAGLGADQPAVVDEAQHPQADGERAARPRRRRGHRPRCGTASRLRRSARRLAPAQGDGDRRADQHNRCRCNRKSSTSLDRSHLQCAEPVPTIAERVTSKPAATVRFADGRGDRYGRAMESGWIRTQLPRDWRVVAQIKLRMAGKPKA